MPPEEKESEKLSREQVLEECEREISLSNQKLLLKLSDYRKRG